MQAQQTYTENQLAKLGQSINPVFLRNSRSAKDSTRRAKEQNTNKNCRQYIETQFRS